MSLFDMDLSSVVNHLFNHVHETSSRDHKNHESRRGSNIPVDILDTPKEYLFFMDVPGLSKSEIQVLSTCLKSQCDI
jgi:HSP20 family protein